MYIYSKTHKNIKTAFENNYDTWNCYANVMEWLFPQVVVVFMCLGFQVGWVSRHYAHIKEKSLKENMLSFIKRKEKSGNGSKRWCVEHSTAA